MSDIPCHPLAAPTAGLLGRLARLRAQIAARLLVDGVSRLLWAALALIAADFALDWAFHMDRAQRVVMLLAMLGLLAWVIYRRLLRPLSVRPSDDALILQVEAANKQLSQRLITALQLARLDAAEKHGMSPAFVQKTIHSAVDESEQIRFDAVLSKRQFRYSIVLLALALVALGAVAYGVAATHPLAIWFGRNVLLQSLSWPQSTYLIIEGVGRDGSIDSPRGEEWMQIVTVAAESKLIPADVFLDFRSAGARPSTAMKRVAERQFEATFESVVEPFEFRARGGDAVTDWVRVELVDPPALAELQLIVTPPAYTGAPAEELQPGRGPYLVLKGSSLRLSGSADKPVAAAELHHESQAFHLPLKLTDPRRFWGQVGPADVSPGQYALVLRDARGMVSRQPTTFMLQTRVDQKPRLQAHLLNTSGVVAPTAYIPYKCRITDDFGVSSVRLAHAVAGQHVRSPIDWPRADSTTDITLDDAFDLAPLGLSPGTNVSFRLEATDNDNISGPNVGQSSDFLVRIVTAEELRADLLRREQEQRQELERLIKEQDDLLTDSRLLQATLPSNVPGPTSDQQGLLIQSHKRQKQIALTIAAMADRLSALVVEIQTNRLEDDAKPLQTRLTRDIVQPLGSLADDLLPQALATLEKARREPAPVNRDAALADAIAHQAEAVSRMRGILDHMIQSEQFQEAINLLYELQKAQTEAYDETTKAQQQRIQRILGGDSKAEKPNER